MFGKNEVATVDGYNGGDALVSENTTSTGEGLLVNPFDEIYFSDGDSTFLGISFIASIVISLVIFFLFVKSGKEYGSRFVNWLKEFLNFRSILIENILEYLYLFLTIFFTIVSFDLIKDSFLAFLVFLIGVNVILRICFEFSLMLIMIWKNTSEISKATKKNERIITCFFLETSFFYNFEFIVSLFLVV